jgi:hypothetical protein
MSPWSWWGRRSRRQSLGILFDIDVLRQTGKQTLQYGQKARLIFMRYFDPGLVRSGHVWHGRMALGATSCWCIAIIPKDVATLKPIRKAFSTIDAQGLMPLRNRFIEHPVDLDMSTENPQPIISERFEEGPSPWFFIDAATIMLSNPIDEDVYLCRRFDRKFRLPRRLAEFVRQIHNGSITATSISGDEDLAEVSAIFAAADVAIPGVPRTLMDLAEVYTTQGNDLYARYCVGQLLEILDWNSEKILARTDHGDLFRVQEYLQGLGYGPSEK